MTEEFGIDAKEKRLLVKDTDNGKKIFSHILDLEDLLRGYRQGEIKEKV